MCNVCDFLLLGNRRDRFAVISRWSALFLDRGGSIEGSITGVRSHSREAGRMEIPCKLMLTAAGKKKHIAKMKRIQEPYRWFEEHCCICI